MIYYIYRHVRLDTNQVFYVGKGAANLKGRSDKVFYCRAFNKTKRGRTKWWHRIANKPGYCVEIVYESHDETLINKKEREFIKLYGRKDSLKGELVNFSDGGEGPSNQVMSEAVKLKMSENAKNRVGIKAARNKTIFVYKVDGTFYKSFFAIKQASVELSIYRGNIDKVLRGDSQQASGFIFKSQYEGDLIHFKHKPRRDSRAVVCTNIITAEVLEFESVASAAKYFHTEGRHMHIACKRRNVHKGYKFEFRT